MKIEETSARHQPTAASDGRTVTRCEPTMTLVVPCEVLTPIIEQAVDQALARLRTVSRTVDRVESQLMYSESQAAKLLGLTPIALKNERARGRIGFLKRGTSIRYLPEHLREYVNSWIQATEAE